MEVRLQGSFKRLCSTSSESDFSLAKTDPLCVCELEMVEGFYSNKLVQRKVWQL